MRDNNPNRLDDGAQAEAEMNARATDESLKSVRDWCASRDEELASRALSAVPAPQGDDTLVGRLLEWAGSYEEGSFDTEEMLMREAASALRSQAAEIAGLWHQCEAWAKLALDNDDSRIAAEARLASAMEALNHAHNFITNATFQSEDFEVAQALDGIILSSLEGSAK